MQKKTYKQIACVSLGLLLGQNLVWLINAMPLGSDPAAGRAVSSMFLAALAAFGLYGLDSKEKEMQSR